MREGLDNIKTGIFHGEMYVKKFVLFKDKDIVTSNIIIQKSI